MLSKPGKPTGLTAAAGNRRVGLSWDPSDDSSIEGYQVLHFVMNKLSSDDHAGGDWFGHSVAMDNGTAVVGAPKHDANDLTNSGAAYVFTRNSSGRWSQVAKLTASDGADGDEFGHSVAVHGDTVVIGAYKHNGNTGTAYVFTRNEEGAWSQEAKLTASDGAAGDEFGYSVAVHGDTVVVGAYQHDANSLSNSGAAYVFSKPTNGGWVTTNTETAKLTDLGGAALDRFGRSVAVHEMEVVVGAYFSEAGKGAAYVFTTPNTGWAGIIAEPAQLAASDGAATDHFGWSVALGGNTIVVGANGDANETGAAYLFTKSDGVWGKDPDSGTHREETAKLTAIRRSAKGLLRDFRCGERQYGGCRGVQRQNRRGRGRK